MTRRFCSVGLLTLFLAGIDCGPIAAQPLSGPVAPAAAMPGEMYSGGPAASQPVDWLAYLPEGGRGVYDGRCCGAGWGYGTTPGYLAGPLGAAPCETTPCANSMYAPSNVSGEGGGNCTYPDTCPATCLQPCQPPPTTWFASVSGLLLSIHSGQHYYFSYDSADESRQLTDWNNVQFEWDGSFEVRFGRCEACTCYGWQAVYWQIFADPESTTTPAAAVAGNLNGILNWDQLDYNGNTADTYVNNAMIHRLRREVDVQNVELNRTISFQPRDCNSGRMRAFFGARFLRFDDDLQFAADTVDTTFTGAPAEIYYDIETENLLIGVQGGWWSEHCLSPRWRLVLGTKAGVFGSHVAGYSRIGGAAGTATVNNGPNIGRQFLVNVDKLDVAILGEFECNLQFAVSSSCRLGLGYRAVGVSGVAVSVDQIYHDLRGLQDVEQLDSDGNLLLHGVQCYFEQIF